MPTFSRASLRVKTTSRKSVNTGEVRREGGGRKTNKQSIVKNSEHREANMAASLNGASGKKRHVAVCGEKKTAVGFG